MCFSYFSVRVSLKSSNILTILRVRKILIFNNIDISAPLHYVDVAVTAAVML